MPFTKADFRKWFNTLGTMTFKQQNHEWKKAAIELWYVNGYGSKEVGNKLHIALYNKSQGNSSAKVKSLADQMHTDCASSAVERKEEQDKDGKLNETQFAEDEPKHYDFLYSKVKTEFKICQI